VREPLVRLLALAQTQHGVSSRRQAAEAGVTRSMLRSALAAGVLTAPVPGVLVVSGAPESWRQRLTVATTAGSGRALVSHRAAATLHGLDGPPFAGVEVTVPRGVRLPWLSGAVVHQTTRLTPADTVLVEGIRTTTVARTLADLGLVTSRFAVEEGVDATVRRDVSVAWVADTLERVHRPGPTGTGVLAGVLRDRQAEAATPESVFERRLLRVLSTGDLPVPVAQHEIRTTDGRFVARVDIAYPPWRLAVEAHSRRHHDGWNKVATDLERDGRLAAVGWERLYVRWPELRQGEAVRERVRAVLRQRGWPARTGRWTS
jgi:hypothetical protein